MIGTTISHYKIVEKLGAGGMGVVYKAEDTKLKRTVALKFLPPDLTRDEEAKNRFIHEAQAASTLDHPNICTVHEINETEDGRIFIVMAFYEGESLENKLEKGPLAIETALDIAGQIAHGLEKAHAGGIIHRDIKPANVFVTVDGQVKIIDFGLAKLSGGTLLTREGTTLGTVAYMSPEQTRGTTVDYRTDIWATGVILYEMLAGERPFKGEYEQAVIYSIMSEEPEFITKIRPDVPLEADKIINRALCKNPDKRFQSMQEMWDALTNITTDIHAGKSRTASPFRLGRKQRKYVIRFVPAVLILLTIFGYVILHKQTLAHPASIALLPLENINRETEQEWFADGMTDALITDLARINSLQIISRSSAMRYKGSKKSPSEIGDELGVKYIIEGSVLKTEKAVNINIRLVDAASEKYLWAQVYECDFKDIRSMQGEMARAIASRIEVKLTSNEETYLSRKKVVNPEAYEAYLRGNFHLYKLTRQEMETALNYFQRAAELDPDYALAYVGIALANCTPAQMGYLPRNESYANAQPAMAKAMEIDQSLPEVQYMKGLIAAWYEWNWDLARSSLEKAIRLNPNMAEARAYYSHLLFTLNRPEEGLSQIKRALELDPFNQLYHWLYAMDLNYLHRYDEAVRECTRVLKSSPRDPGTLSTLRTTYHLKGMYKEAIEIWRRSFEAQGDQESLEALNKGYEEGGYSMALRRVAESKIAQSKIKYITPWQIATLYTRANMPEEALTWLEKALIDHDPNIPYITVDPIFDYMRDNPRFKSLIHKIGL